MISYKTLCKFKFEPVLQPRAILRPCEGIRKLRDVTFPSWLNDWWIHWRFFCVVSRFHLSGTCQIHLSYIKWLILSTLWASHLPHMQVICHVNLHGHSRIKNNRYRLFLQKIMSLWYQDFNTVSMLCGIS